MPQPRTATASANANVTTAYSLSLLSEYTHTLDSLPLDLSRNFADLRELDAVLSSSMSSITSKIHKLTTMVEEDTSSKDERLWLLGEIAEEATRLKLGGEDKIRVACQAADNLRSHTGHMRNLLEHLPNFDPRELRRRTTYPHIASKAFMPAAGMERGRGRRGGFGSILSSTVESPAKRKRVVRDDDGEHAHRSPRKDKAVEGSSRPRNPGGRTKKCVYHVCILQPDH
jgi:inhibitor of growth protein 3